MTAISGSGCNAIGMASFSSSAVVSFGASAGGATGFASGVETAAGAAALGAADGVWHLAKLTPAIIAKTKIWWVFIITS
jgi:hypothetical protein